MTITLESTDQTASAGSTGAPTGHQAAPGAPAGLHTAARRTGSGADPAWFAGLQRGSIVASTIAVGLAAGFFFTYQISVTRGLAIVDDHTYVETFQAINSTIRNGWFGVVFFGAIPILVATLALHWRSGPARRSTVGAALVCYLITFGITAFGSVPLNDELGAVTARTPGALAAARADYEGTWNTLNLIRTLTCVAALAAIAMVGRIRRAAE